MPHPENVQGQAEQGSEQLIELMMFLLIIPSKQKPFCDRLSLILC